MRYNLKLEPRYYRPFQIVAKVGVEAYKLNLPTFSRIHPLFHVSCHKRKLGQHITPLPSLPPVDHKGNVQPKPEAILDRRMKKFRNQVVIEVLIRWGGTLLEDSTWESLWKLRDLYPHLVGKVILEEGCCY
ncbi:uncharacterized protein LOC121236566 [Juglans microcarpa x Juglans regia]|uniref:uncharacterized protein LOC121236566 n=1 Tax=Juglans microcarpa x Juglans regia TaxID=2249226 RepID=UPI001B7DFD7A|nr:uncharacterized protein LOC121236566 [Juglans microcarpa x Juglans regia]